MIFVSQTEQNFKFERNLLIFSYPPEVGKDIQICFPRKCLIRTPWKALTKLKQARELQGSPSLQDIAIFPAVGFQVSNLVWIQSL